MIKILKDTPGHLLIEIEVSEANLDNSDLFKSQVTELLDRHQKNIVIDFNKVEYIDSSFIGALVAILKHAMSQKLDVILTAMRQDVYDLLLLIRLDKVFKIYGNYNEAAAIL
jgi:anti-sigma B factor antagonist